MKRGRWKPERYSSTTKPAGAFSSAPAGRGTTLELFRADGVAKGGGSLKSPWANSPRGNKQVRSRCFMELVYTSQAGASGKLAFSFMDEHNSWGWASYLP